MESTVKGRTGTQKTMWNRRKKQEFKKKRRGLGTSATTLNVPTPE